MGCRALVRSQSVLTFHLYSYLIFIFLNELFLYFFMNEYYWNYHYWYYYYYYNLWNLLPFLLKLFFLMDFNIPFIIFIITITMIIIIFQIYSNHLYLILFLGILKRERRCMIWQFKIYIEVFSDNSNNGPHGILWE